MRYAIGALTLALLVPLSIARADDIDKKATDIVKKAAEIYKDAKAIHADVTIETTAGEGDQKKVRKVEATYDLERPNLLAIRTKQGGIEVTSDGKKLLIDSKHSKEYAEEEAPASMTDLGQQILRLGPPNVGMLFPNVMIDDPYETLMSGVTDCKLAGTEKVDGVETHHITFKQPEFDWELYIAAEGKPYVLRMTNTRSGDDNKVTVVETYKNWKVQDSMDKSVFTVTPPKDAKKVDQIDPRGGQEDKDK
jgi:hypothetical protein